MRVLVGVCAYNEAHRIKPVLEELKKVQKKEKFDVVIVDDGSNDGTNQICSEYAKNNNWHIITHEKNSGVGRALKDIAFYAKENNFDVITTMSANGKTDVKELKKMYVPVVEEGYEYVKGSRYMKGGKSPNLPIFRRIAIPIYSFFVSIIMGRKITDVTCLINAMNIKVLDDKRININQDWLDKYEYEYYVLYYALKLKKKFKEVPMTIKYPKERKNYSKIKPFSGWWSMVRPWFILKLGIKK